MNRRYSGPVLNTTLALLFLLSTLLTVSAQDGQQSSESGLRQLRARELAQASYDELRIEAGQLGLPVDGTRGDLERRILAHLGIDRFAAEVSEETLRLIEIEQAAELQLLRSDQADADIIRLTGGVVVRLEDDETGNIHVIAADSITINRRESIVSAGGEVVYTIDRSGEIERFTGETLTVELNEWAGTFLYGISTRPRTIEGQDFDFRFSGRTISRSADDVIIIDDGTITSSVADPPNYRITADRIWILDTGDWGLRNAVLYVGRVPMFWFPVFFHPGRPMFIHPAIGTRDGAGAFIQTTIYLTGAREDRSQPFSVLQLAEDDRGDGRVREGLFLRPAREGEEVEDGDRTVRVYADAYSTGAAFFAVDADLPQSGSFSATRAFAGIGVSRIRYQAADGSIGSLYWNPETHEFEQYWSRSMFPGLDSPVRLGLNLETGFRSGPLRLSLQLPFYSDPVFERDYLQRSEFIDWGSIIGFSDDETAMPSVRSSLQWRLQANYSPDVRRFRPYLTQASLQTFSAELNWRRRVVPDLLLEPWVREAANAPYDPPDRSFFYPDRLVFPNATATLAGTLLEYPVAGARVEDPGRQDAPPAVPLRPPFNGAPADQSDDSGAIQSLSESGFRLPPARDNLRVQRPADPFSGQLAYRLSPSITVAGQYASSQWQEPDDVDYEIEYWEQLRRTQGSLSWRAAYLSSVFAVRGTTSVSDRYRTVFGFSDRIEENRENELRLRAFGEHSTVVDNRLRLSSAPLDQQPLLEGSELSYTLDVRLLQRRFSEVSENNAPLYETDTIGWDRDRIQRHSVQLVSALNVLDARQTLTLGLDLPPRQERGRSELTLRTGIVQSTARLSYVTDDDDGERSFDPFSVTQSITPVPRVRFSHQWSYDLEEAHLSTGRLDLQLGGFTGRLDGRRSESFTFDLLNFTWVGDDNEVFRPVQASLRYNESFDSFIFWKNRITITPSVQSNAAVNLLRFTDSTLSFRLNLELNVHRFLDLRFSSESRNDQLFRYIGPYADELGLQRVSLLEDLVRSFNFFNRSDRIESAFKLRQLRIDAVHDLGDWDLTVGYRGSPQQVTGADGATVEWRSTVELLLQWRPIPEISRDLTITDEEIIW